MPRYYYWRYVGQPMRPRTISTVLSLKQLCLLCNHCAKKKINSYIQLQSDNSTTVACITIKGVLNQLVMT